MATLFATVIAATLLGCKTWRIKTKMGLLMALLLRHLKDVSKATTYSQDKGLSCYYVSPLICSQLYKAEQSVNPTWWGYILKNFFVLFLLLKFLMILPFWRYKATKFCQRGCERENLMRKLHGTDSLRPFVNLELRKICWTVRENRQLTWVIPIAPLLVKPASWRYWKSKKRGMQSK